MKRIRKTHPPREFLNWINTQIESGLELTYTALEGKPEHLALKKKLLKEQGYLCAYTGLSISLDASHIEHLKPQTVCKNVENPERYRYLDDIEYRNMVACFPKDGGDISYGYGAPVKGGWWNESEFVSPCQEDCEKRFSYKMASKVSPVDENDIAAKKTIEVIGLNARSLLDKRKSKILGFFGIGKNSSNKPLSKLKAQEFLNTIGKPDSTGKLTEFCFVYEQLLPRYINSIK